MTSLKLNRRLLRLIVFPVLAALLGACGQQQDDMHAAPREPKPYESQDPANLSKDELLARLQTIASDTRAAVASNSPVEFHYLEVALTPTLEALEPHAAGQTETLAAIESLKQLAVKLHEAGHDGNTAMGAKLETRISQLSKQIASDLR